MSEAVWLKLIDNLPAILTALASLATLILSLMIRKSVNGGISELTRVVTQNRDGTTTEQVTASKEAAPGEPAIKGMLAGHQAVPPLAAEQK